MIIKFYKPFDRICGDEMELDLDGSRSLKNILGMISERHEGFRKYSETAQDRELRLQMLVLREGHPVNLRDMIEPGDQLAVFPIAAGG